MTQARRKCSRKNRSSMARAEVTVRAPVRACALSERPGSIADTSSTASNRPSAPKIGAPEQLKFICPRPEMLASVDCYGALLGDAGADAVGTLNVLGPDATEPGSPVFELARLRSVAAMLDRDPGGVAEQDRVASLANHFVQAVELLLRGRDEVVERLTRILQLASGEDARRPAVEGIDAVRGTLPGA
jgi:hypothetical protein